jgi:hypothetical protein
LFAGLDLLSARKPEGFVDEFFNHEKLFDIWEDGLKTYRAMEDNFTRSGIHGSIPRFETLPSLSFACF